MRRPMAAVDAELFVELAGEGLLGGFAGLDLAAGELPFEAHGLIGAALADEDLGFEAVLGFFLAQDRAATTRRRGLPLARPWSSSFRIRSFKPVPSPAGETIRTIQLRRFRRWRVSD